MPKTEKKVVVYQAKNGAIELRGDFSRQTLWATLQQIADVFDVDKSGVSRHIQNIYRTKELARKGTVAKIATVQTEGHREVLREVEYYNLDVIISVGYRVNSRRATVFRQWATKTLRSHIVDGFTINKRRLAKNYNVFLKAVEEVKRLLPVGGEVSAGDTLELVKLFASTWFSLDAYDKSTFPTKGTTKKSVTITAKEFEQALEGLKNDLIIREEATDLFAQEKSSGSVSGIIGNVLQAFGGQDVYPTLEEKAAHLLYFMVKNHPFVDGNKRSGAFAFVWFLKKFKLLDVSRLTPVALTALTLLIAESKPSEKERMTGLVLMLLQK